MQTRARFRYALGAAKRGREPARRPLAFLGLALGAIAASLYVAGATPAQAPPRLTPVPDATGPAIASAGVAAAAESPAAPTTPILDDFNRTPDEDPLSQGGNWSPYDAWGPGGSGHVLSLVSQRAANIRTFQLGFGAMSHRIQGYSGDLEAYATVAVKPVDGTSVSIISSYRQDGGPWDAYYFSWRAESGEDRLTIAELTDGTSSTLHAGPVALEMNAGDKMLVRRIGSVIEGWVFHNGSWSRPLVAEDPTPLMGGKIGILIGGSPGGNAARFDDFGGGGFSVAPPVEQSNGTCGVGVHAYSRSACRGNGVNTLTGAFTTQVVDLALPGIGVPFAFTRTYTSTSGWTHNYATSLADAAPLLQRRARSSAAIGEGDVLFRGDEGQEILYFLEENGTFTGALGAHSTLTSTGSGFDVLRREQVAYRYDLQGRLTEMRDRNNQGLTFAYDPVTGKLASITDSVGRVIDVIFTGDLLTRVELPDGRFVQYGYTNERLTSVLDTRGGTTSYEYDEEGRLERIVNPRGKQVVRNVYGASGRVAEQFDALEKGATFSGDPQAGEAVTMTDAESHTWTDVYANGVVVERRNQIDPPTRFEYDDDLNVTKITDPRGNATTMTYDERGNLLTRTPPAPFSQSEEVWTYTARNDPDTYRDGHERTTDYDYDGAGNLETITQPDADGPGPLGQPLWTYGRDPGGSGLLVSITDPRTKQTTFSYTDGNLTEIRTHLGHRTTMCYDSSGRMVGRVDPRGTQSCALPNPHRWLYTYNEHDQLESQTDPLGHETVLEYDAAGNLERATDANEHATTYEYDDANRLKTVTSPDPDDGGPLAPSVTAHTYDDVGNLDTRTDAEGRLTDYDYDAANRPDKTTAPLNRVWTYDYDANGNLGQVVDANGNDTPAAGDGMTIYGYDELNRVKLINYSGTTPDVFFTYDANGNLHQMTDGPGAAGTETYAYHPLNQLKSVSRGGATVFSYEYDIASFPKTTTYPDATSVGTTYDDDGRLQSLASGALTTTYAYDAAGNLETTTLPSGPGQNGHVVTRLWDPAGRLFDVKHQKAAVVLNRSTYTLDAVGNAEVIVRQSGTETYRYDNLDRLTRVCFHAGACPGTGDFIRWAYDKVGNRTEEERPSGMTLYDYNEADELETAGSTTYTFDKNGNQKTAGTQTFTWDLANRLQSTTSTSGTVTYDYDGLGKRVQATGGALSAPALRPSCPTAIGSSGPATVNKPAGTAQGDLLIVGLAFEKGSDSTITPPSGWTRIRRTTQSSNVGYETYRKVAGASEPASYAFTLTNSPKWSIGVCAITGASATAPIDADQGSLGPSGQPLAPSVTTSGASRLILAFYANKKPATYSNYASPAQERWDAPNGPGGLPSNAMAFYERPSAGATGAKSATASEAAEWVAQQIAIAPGTPVSKFLWDVNRPLPELALERNGGNELVRRYLHGTDLHAYQTPAGTFYYHADGLGSITNVTDAAGVKQRSYVWEPFGRLRSESQDVPTAPANPMRFAGEYEDSTGLYHLRARQYDPQTGRFLSRDPIPSAGSAYPYAGNNPLAYADPSGLAFGPFDEAWRSLDSRGRALIQGVGEAIGAHGHTALNVGGAVPIAGEPLDLINCAWYGSERDYANAALSCGATLPWLGVLAVAARTGRKAAKAAPAIVRGGETAATRYGREIHRTFDYGLGFRREFTLPSGRRADAVNLRIREVVELKPNNPRAIAHGRRQVEAYAAELEELYPGMPFTRRLETYDRP